MTTITGRRDWAEEEDEHSPLPQQKAIRTKDLRIADTNGEHKIPPLVIEGMKLSISPRVAERRTWKKFGAEKGKPPGPQSDTVSVAENMEFRPMVNWKPSQEEGTEQEKKKDAMKDAKIKCRICNGEHWTLKCPHKDAMAPAGAAGSNTVDANDSPDVMGASGGGGTYVAPGLRKGAGGAGERGGKHERDDLATLRVTNVSENAEEHDIREMFARFGQVTRVFLAKDRDTNRAKGFAFVSFADRQSAAVACREMDGFGFHHLILRVEFSKKTT